MTDTSLTLFDANNSNLQAFASATQHAQDRGDYAGVQGDAAKAATADARTATDAIATLSLSGNLATLLTESGYITPAGAVQADVRWRHSKRLRTTPGDQLQLDLVGNPNVATLLYRDAGGAILSAVVTPAGSDARMQGTYTAPANAYTLEVTTGLPGDSGFAPLGSAYTAYAVSAPDRLLALSVDQIKALATNLSGSLNLALVMTLGGYYQRDGTLVADPNWVHSPKIAVTPGNWFSVDLVGQATVANLLFRDASGSPIPAGVISVPDSGNAALRGQYIAPAGAATLEISSGRPGVSGDAPLASTYSVVHSTGQIAQSGDDLALLATRVGYLDANGVIHADPTWRYSDPIIGQPGYRLQIDVPTQSAAASVAFYGDAAGTVFQSTIGSPSTPLDSFVANEAWPVGAVSARVCYYANPALADYPLSTRRTIIYSSPSRALRSGRVKPGDVLVAYGDSRSSVDYPSLAKAYTRALGVKTTLAGWQGHTVVQNASNADLARLFASTSPRVIVVLPGGNDSGGPGSVGTFSASSPNGVGGETVVTRTDISQDFSATGAASFIQAVDHMMRKIVAQYVNVRGRANLSGSESQNVLNGKMQAVVRPIFILCTDLPQQRIDASNAFSQPANWERKRQAILEVGRLIPGVEVVDTMHLMPIDMSKEPFFPGTTDITKNYGNLTMDGLHKNPVGDDLNAEVVILGAGL